MAHTWVHLNLARIGKLSIAAITDADSTDNNAMTANSKYHNTDTQRGSGTDSNEHQEQTSRKYRCKATDNLVLFNSVIAGALNFEPSLKIVQHPLSSASGVFPSVFGDIAASRHAALISREVGAHFRGATFEDNPLPTSSYDSSSLDRYLILFRTADQTPPMLVHPTYVPASTGV